MAVDTVVAVDIVVVVAVAVEVLPPFAAADKLLPAHGSVAAVHIVCAASGPRLAVDEVV